MNTSIPLLRQAPGPAHRGRWLAVGVTVLVGVLLHSPAEAQVNIGNDAAVAELSVADVFLFGTSAPVAAASSTMIRTSHGVAMTLSTRGLQAGHVYTIWWVIFGEPQFCATIPCTGADLANPAVMGSVAWATGDVADGWGFASFAAHLVPGAPEGVVVAGNAAFNTRIAELHLVVRHHNEVGANGAILLQQLTTLNAGCVGPCIDVQAAIHLR